MKRLLEYLSILGLSLLIAQSTIRAEDKPQAKENPLAPFERFIGTWTVEGKWSDGSELRARSVYDWGINNKVITAKTFVKNKDTEYQRYEGVIGWNLANKKLYEISFAYDGSVSEVIIDVKDQDTLQIGYTPYEKDQPSRVRQTLHFKDKDTFTWTVLLKEGHTWKTLIEADWKRQTK